MKAKYRKALEDAKALALEDAKALEDAGSLAKEGLLERCEAAFVLALTTTAEAYFVEILTRTSQDKMKGALQKRIATMSKKELDPELLQPVIWRQVQDNVA